MISALLLAAVPVHASPIDFGQVVNIVGGWQNSYQPDQLRLRAFTQEPSTPSTAGTSSPGTTTQSLVAPTASVEAASEGPIQPSLVAGSAVAAPQPGTDGEVLQNAQVFQQDNIDGTICDCGEIPVAGGGFPKWPLLFLAGIPLFFLIHHHHVPPPTPPPGPTPTPPPPPSVPEPTTLLLLGSGLAALGAGARRRRARKRMDNELTAVTEA
jgi:hypothetical protein